jgi:hypothetical protein
MRLKAAIRVCVVAVLISSEWSAGATEKLTIAAEAKMVVVGRLLDATRIPWFDGWHIKGDLLVEEVLFGSGEKAGSKLAYSFRCSCCAMWPPPDVSATLKKPGVWFLAPRDGTGFTSAGSCSDPGWRPIETRGAFGALLRGRATAVR